MEREQLLRIHRKTMQVLRIHHKLVQVPHIHHKLVQVLHSKGPEPVHNMSAREHSSSDVP